MATNSFLTRIQLRHDTPENWTSVNPILAQGEIGIEVSTVEGESTPIIKIKIGDGTTAWNTLSYYGVANSTTALFEVVPQSSETDIQAINRVVTDPETGNFAIVKRAIAGDKQEYTAYVYADGVWSALDGNYDAENVYFAKDLTITAPVGVQTIPSTGSKTLETAGKNIKQVLDMLFAAEKNPTTVQPGVSVTLNSAGAKEVGTEFTPTYTASLTAGSYTYGPATGVSATSYSITDTNGNNATTSSGSLPVFTVSESTNYRVTANVTYSDGAIPVTNLGNPYAEGQIQGATKTANSTTVTGYRAWFMGYKTADTILDVNNLTSNNIRNLGNAANGNFKASFTTTNMQQMFFAAPQGLVSSVEVSNSVNGAPQTVKKTTVNVEGANGFTAVPYDVFYVNNAVAEDGTTTFTIKTVRV